jgi:hypothetical protein
MDIEHLEKRFGVTAVDKGFINSDHVVEALTIQVAEDLSIGTHRPIGKILMESELMTLEQVEEVLESMGISENNA